MVGARGVPPLVEAHIQRIQIPTASYSISVSVHYEELQIRRYPAFNRAKERAAIAMAITEDDQVFALLDRAVAAGPNTVFNVTGNDAMADRGNFVDLFRTLSSRQLPLGAYVMHPWRYGDVLSWGSADLDQVSLNVIVKYRRHASARVQRKLTKFGGPLTAQKGTRQYRAKPRKGKV